MSPGLFFTILTSLAAAATFPFSEGQREAYLEKTIQSFHETPKQAAEDIYRFIDLSEKQKCRSFFESVTLNCLQKETQKNCESGAGATLKNCAVLSDALLVNKVNEDRFLSKEARFAISENSANFSLAYTKALDTQYGLLATQMLLLSKNRCREDDAHCLAKEVDQYCLGHSDTKGLPWQACAVAILWFIGN